MTTNLAIGTDAPIQRKWQAIPRWVQDALRSWETNPGLVSLADVDVPDDVLAGSPQLGSVPSDTYGFFSPEPKEAFRTKEMYINWLQESYQGTLAGLEILADTLPSAVDKLMCTGLERDLELEAFAKEEIKQINKQFCKDVAVVRAIPDEDWNRIAGHEHPGVALVIYLGVPLLEARKDFEQDARLHIAGRLMQERTYPMGRVPLHWDNVDSILLDAVHEYGLRIFTSPKSDVDLK